jgi:hypothetical protein
LAVKTIKMIYNLGLRDTSCECTLGIEAIYMECGRLVAEEE